MTTWVINPHDADDGTRFFTVEAEANGDRIVFTVDTERKARELRDTLNRLGRTVNAWACAGQ